MDSIGEEDLLQIVTTTDELSDNVLLGPGDDDSAAVWWPYNEAVLETVPYVPTGSDNRYDIAYQSTQKALNKLEDTKYQIVLAFFGIDVETQDQTRVEITREYRNGINDVISQRNSSDYVGGDINEMDSPSLVISAIGGRDAADNNRSVVDTSSYNVLVSSLDGVNRTPLAGDSTSRWHHAAGRWVVQCNASDVISTGSQPLTMQLWGGLPNQYSETIDWDSYPDSTGGFWEEIVSGARAEMDYMDISENGICKFNSKSRVLGGTIIGGISTSEIPKQWHDVSELRTLSGANPGDVVILLGVAGLFPTATMIYETRATLPNGSKEIESKLQETLQRRHRVEKGAAQAASGLGSGGIDLSDAPIQDLTEMASASGVEIIIEENKIPVPKHIEAITNHLSIPSASMFYNHNGDYAIAYTMSEKCWENSRRMIKKMGKATQIGRVVPERTVQKLSNKSTDDRIAIKRNENYYPISGDGYEPFVSSPLEDLHAELLYNYLSSISWDEPWPIL